MKHCQLPLSPVIYHAPQLEYKLLKKFYNFLSDRKHVYLDVMLLPLYFCCNFYCIFYDKEANFQCHVDHLLCSSNAVLLHFDVTETNFQCHVEHSPFCLIQLLLHFCDKKELSVSCWLFVILVNAPAIAYLQ